MVGGRVPRDEHRVGGVEPADLQLLAPLVLRCRGQLAEPIVEATLGQHSALGGRRSRRPKYRVRARAVIAASALILSPRSTTISETTTSTAIVKSARIITKRL